jgi:hypothetical protein
MRVRLYINHTDALGQEVPVPTAAGLALFVLAAGLPFTFGLAFDISRSYFGLVFSWVLGGIFGLWFGAVRGGLHGAFNSGFFCALSGVFVLLFVASAFSPSMAMPALMFWCFAGPLLVGIYSRQETLRQLHSRRARAPALPAQNDIISPGRTPYPPPYQAQLFVHHLTEPGKDGVRRPSP